MAYKPKNVATAYRDKSTMYSPGSGTGYSGPGMVPGATGSDDQESQPKGAEFYNDGQVRRTQPDFSIMDGGNDQLDPRKNPNHGQASYNYEKPSL